MGLEEEERVKVLWFRYDTKTNVSCVVLFVAAWINLLIQFVWIMNYRNNISEFFQYPEFHYGQVACCNSMIVMLISLILIIGAEHYSKIINWVIPVIAFFQTAQILLEFLVLYDIKLLWYAVLQPVPFLVTVLLFLRNKISLKAALGMCILDYILFLGKEFLYWKESGICFWVVYDVGWINISRIMLCVMFCSVLSVRAFLSGSSNK